MDTITFSLVGVGLVTLGIFVKMKGINDPKTKGNFLIGGGLVILCFVIKRIL